MLGETVTKKRPEEHLETNDAWVKWLAEQRLASKYHVIETQRNYTVTGAVLTEDANAFEVIANMRRQAVISQRKTPEQQDDKPVSKSKSKNRTVENPKPPTPR